MSSIVLWRNRERPRHKQLPEIRALENPDEEFDIAQHLPNVTEEEYIMNPSAYREVCWDIKVKENGFLCAQNKTLANLNKIIANVFFLLKIAFIELDQMLYIS